jgi:molybdopterin-containing oxidoreductase family membrane subunit
MPVAAPFRQKLIKRNKSFSAIADDILAPIEGKPMFWWKVLMGMSLLMVGGGGYCIFIVWWDGIGMWGENHTVNWAWDITSFVWWIGIGHAGTLISAILLVFRQKWRNSINRTAEAMTLAAVTCSAFYIFAHLGRVWVSYWIFPIPTELGVWVNFNSALIWDATAILTYFILSLLFWYSGLVPDLAIMRDRTGKKIKKYILNFFCLGWDNSSWNWRRYRPMMNTMAGILTALVVSVHSVVSMDFATGLVPGWHSTIFPPYFVIGAIFSGFAMVLTILVPIRKIYKLENYITTDHLESMNKFIILTSGLVGISYISEFYVSTHVSSPYETFTSFFKIHGTWSFYYWIMMTCNVALPQLLWIRPLRRNFLFSFVLSLFINLGMWVERFVIIVTSLARDFLPSSWSYYRPTLYTIGTFIFSMGLFMFLLLLFFRYLPSVSVSEVRELAAEEK